MTLRRRAVIVLSTVGAVERNRPTAKIVLRWRERLAALRTSTALDRPQRVVAFAATHGGIIVKTRRVCLTDVFAQSSAAFVATFVRNAVVSALVTGPTPLPILRSPIALTPMISAAVPVRKISSAP